MSDILYLEADNTYTNIVTENKKYTIRLTMGNVLERLPMKDLVRIHRSFAVNINKIESFTEQEVSIHNLQIPLSRTYKDDFMRHFMFR